MSENPQFKRVSINQVYPQSLDTRFANYFIIQHEADFFTLSFFEVLAPALVGTDEEKRARLDAIDQLDAKCVARIVVTPSQMQEFVEAANENLRNYERTINSLERGE